MPKKGYKQNREHKEKIALAHINMEASEEAKIIISLQ